MMGQKITRICLDCGKEFEATNLGPLTRLRCNPCSEKRVLAEEEANAAAVAAMEEAKYRDLIRMAQIPTKWRNVRFENSDPTKQPTAFKVAKRYAETFNTNSPSLVLYSPGKGTGKTHLAACIVNHVLHEKKLPVLFKTARDLMLEIRRTFSDRDLAEADVLDMVLSVQLLLLDDVGVDPASRWLQATYWTVFGRRLDWQLPVLVTTNKPLEALQGETER